jgi:glutamate-1-semialdehyde 2,1-aminomutase
VTAYSHEKSRALFERAAKVIPCGIYGHFSPAPLIPPSDYPFYAESGAGSRFVDVDGNSFIDYMCAYGPMVLGYAHKKVDAAAAKEHKKGSCLSAPAPVMVELAEYLVDLVFGMDWAFFAKNGNDVTTYAVMVARAATGRKKVVAIKGGYHGVAPWTQGLGHHGVLEEDCGHILRIAWNDFDAFASLVEKHPGQIAAFIASPYHHPVYADNQYPAPGYWQKVQKLCNQKGIVLIVDDIRCGFRLNMAGSHVFFGFEPDLVCFCKAIANGYPISALMGKGALLTDAAKVFYTGSYWFSSAPMAAALATLAELKRINGPELMLAFGEKLCKGLAETAKSHGYDLKVSGAPSMPYLRITDDPSQMLHQKWCGLCTSMGAYFTSHHNWFVSTAHNETDLTDTLKIADRAFEMLKKEKR